jgi:hypothetical protein
MDVVLAFSEVVFRLCHCETYNSRVELGYNFMKNCVVINECCSNRGI